jgi:hypothetical protein
MMASFVTSASSFAIDHVPQREAKGKKEDPKSWFFSPSIDDDDSVVSY